MQGPETRLLRRCLPGLTEATNEDRASSEYPRQGEYQRVRSAVRPVVVCTRRRPSNGVGSPVLRSRRLPEQEVRRLRECNCTTSQE